MGILQNVLETVVKAGCSDKGETAVKVVTTTAKVIGIVALHAIVFIDSLGDSGSEAQPFE